MSSQFIASDKRRHSIDLESFTTLCLYISGRLHRSHIFAVASLCRFDLFCFVFDNGEVHTHLSIMHRMSEIVMVAGRFQASGLSSSFTALP